MSYGNGAFGSSEFGGTSFLFQVVSARSINPYTVVVTFSATPDFSDPETLNPANYYIDAEDSPGDVIGAPLHVVPGLDGNTVALTTPAQVYVLYTVTVNPIVMSDTGTPIDAEGDSAKFTGTPIPDAEQFQGFSAKAIRANGLNLVFPQPMVVGLAFTDPLSYTIRDLQGNPVQVVGVTPNLPSGATRVALTLGADLRSGVAYEVRLSPTLLTESGLSIIPDFEIVVWVERRKIAKVPFSVFTGEVQAPPTGVLNLSEALSVQESLSAVLAPYRLGPIGADALVEALSLGEGLDVYTNGLTTPANKAVTVSEVLDRLEKLSPTRYPDGRATIEASFSDILGLQESLQVLPDGEDHKLSDNIAKLFGNPNGLVFFSPALVDGGAPLSSIQVDEVKACTQAYDVYRFPQTVDPQPFYLYGSSPTLSTLNSAVLFTNFYRLNEAIHKLTDRSEDVAPPTSDVSVTIQLTQVWPPARVSLLNNPGWTTFDGIAGPPYDFITADNLSAFPAPTLAPTHHYWNPSETLSLTESPVVVVETSASVSDAVIMTETYDLVPGETVVQVNVSETLTSGEAVSTHIGINLFETLVQSAVVNLST